MADLQRDHSNQKENSEIRKMLKGRLKCGMENAMLFNILASMGKPRNTVYKEALKM
jgi:hypothetical protein